MEASDTSMRRTIGTPIHHSALEQGKIYYLKHDSLGEAEVRFEDGKLVVLSGMLASRASGKRWGRGHAVTLPNYDGAHFYEPAA